jgi:hypothetical protein
MIKIVLRVIDNFHHVTLFESHVAKFRTLVGIKSYNKLASYISGSRHNDSTNKSRSEAAGGHVSW